MTRFSNIKCASEVRVKHDKQSEDAGYPKGQGGVFWQVSICTYRGVHCCRYSGQANVLLETLGNGKMLMYYGVPFVSNTQKLRSKPNIVDIY